MQSTVERSGREKVGGANGIDWIDDAPGWWLAGLKRRERMAVGGKKRGPHGFRTRQREGKGARGRGERGCQSSPN